jgi:hypothetical protein
MPAAGILLLAGAAAVYGVRAPVARALALLVGVTILVPATLVVPNGVSSYPTLGRVVLVAVAANLVRRYRAGELQLGVLRLTPVHAALGVLVFVSLVCGVALAAPATSTEAAVGTFLGVLEQLAFFTVVLVAIRVLDDPKRVLRIVGAVVAVSALIATVEHLTGSAWGHFLFRGLAGQQGTNPARPLELRSGEGRVRAGAQFALQFGWVSIALVPSLFVAALVDRRRARWWLGLAALVVLTVVWSASRSAFPGLALGLVVLWVASGFHRRVGAALLGGVLVVLLAVALVPSLTHRLDRNADEGSIQSRTEKVPAVLAFVSSDPWTGLGHNGLDPTGIRSTDNSFLLAYAETGVIGAVAFGVVLVTALGFALRGLPDDPPDVRLVHAAAVGGAVALVAGGFAFDAFSLQGSTGPFWLLVALALACGEYTAGPYQPRRLPAARLLLPAFGLVAGLVVLVAAPTHAVRNLRFDALPASSIAAGQDDQLVLGRRLVASGCPVAEGVARELGATPYCRELDVPGSFLLRLEAPSSATVEVAAKEARAAVDQVLDEVEVADVDGLHRGRPSGATTAPLSGLLAGAALAAFVPARRRELVPA